MNLFILFTLILGFANAQPINLASCVNTTEDTVLFPAVLGSPIATLVANVFTVNWVWLLTETRVQLPSYQFGNCTLQAVPDVSNAVTNCSLDQSASSSWNALTSTCGWTGTTINGILTYTGSIFLNGSETFIDTRGITQTRALTYQFSLAVDFPSNISISSGITAFAPVLVDSFIVSQAYDVLTGLGVVNFQTQVQYPWSILISTVTVDNSNTASAVSDGGNPGTIGLTLGTLSDQNWILTITPASGVCVLDGTYTIAAALICTLTNSSACPTLSAPSTFNFVLVITSENFCGQIGVDVPLSGVLQVFGNPGLSIRSTDFVSGAVSYYQLIVTSPAATITDISIIQVTLTALTAVINDTTGTPTTSLVLYDGTNWISTIAPTTLTAAGSDGGIQSFSFGLNGDLLLIPRDSAVDLSVTAQALVTFLGAKKRTAMVAFGVSTQTKSYAATIKYSLSSSSLTSPSLVLSIVMTFIAAFLKF
jgi:hypothetical protein